MQDGSNRTCDYQELWQQFARELLTKNSQFLAKYIDLQKALIEQQSTYLRDIEATQEALPHLAKVTMAYYLNILAFQREYRALSADAYSLASEMYLRFLNMLKESTADSPSDGK